MTTRLPKLAAIAFLPAILACDQSDATRLTSTTVQMAIVAGAQHGGAPFATPLSQEVTSTPVFAGDPDGSGMALITINYGQRELCWEISVEGIALPATSSHIHRAEPGVRGPIVVGLSAPDASGKSAGCKTVDDAALLKDILHVPEAFYVNVHTSEFPPGAVRGQLGR